MIRADRVASAVIWKVWHRSPDPALHGALKDCIATPRDLPLRGRFLTLTGGEIGPRDAGWFAVSFDVFLRENALLRAGAAALMADDVARATSSFDAVLAEHNPDLHPFAVVDAHLGLADVARQRGEGRTALKHDAAALELALTCGHRLGVVRALVAEGYLHLSGGSAHQAHLAFERAASLADEGMEIETGNALTGLADARQRLGRTADARAAGLLADRIFTVHDPGIGLANARLQLADTARRAGWSAEAANWYRQSLAAAQRSGALLPQVNALDGVAETATEAGRLEEAQEALEEMLRLTTHAYPRGRALGLDGLARISLRRDHPSTAILRATQAQILWRHLGDPIAEASSRRKIAESAGRLGDTLERVRQDVVAVGLVELARSAQHRALDQDEYFSRFGRFYEHAILSAVEARSVGAFVAVFEAMAGRRIAGILAGAVTDPSEAQLLASLLIQTDRRISEALTGRAAPVTDRPAVLRALGVRALWLALPDEARRAFDDTLAGLYRPLTVHDANTLMEQLAGERVACCVLLPRAEAIAWLLRKPGGGYRIYSKRLDPDTLALVDRLHRDGLDPAWTPSDIAPLAELIPARMLQEIPSGSRIQIVPAGRLWAVPWPAVPVEHGTPFALRNRLRFAPSIVATAHRTDRRPVPGGDRRHWRSPHSVAHALEGLAGESAPIADAAAAAALLRDGGDIELLTLLAHGTPRRGFTHTIDLDASVSISPPDLLTATTPRRLAIVSCWGANTPGRPETDAVTVATVSLTRSTVEAMATTAELIDDAASALFVDLVLHEAVKTDFATALHRAATRWLQNPAFAAGPVARWAPLIALGTARKALT